MEGTYDPSMEGTYDPSMEGTYDPSMEGTYDPSMEGTSDPSMEGTFDGGLAADGVWDVPIGEPNFIIYAENSVGTLRTNEVLGTTSDVIQPSYTTIISGAYKIADTWWDDLITGTDGNDQFRMNNGGNDVVSGGLGEDTFRIEGGNELTDFTLDNGANYSIQNRDTFVSITDYEYGERLLFEEMNLDFTADLESLVSVTYVPDAGIGTTTITATRKNYVESSGTDGIEGTADDVWNTTDYSFSVAGEWLLGSTNVGSYFELDRQDYLEVILTSGDPAVAFEKSFETQTINWFEGQSAERWDIDFSMLPDSLGGVVLNLSDGHFYLGDTRVEAGTALIDGQVYTVPEAPDPVVYDRFRGTDFDDYLFPDRGSSADHGLTIIWTAGNDFYDVEADDDIHDPTHWVSLYLGTYRSTDDIKRRIDFLAY
jgi:hypothetical protein